MAKPITSDTLHALGIQSYLNDDEGYFKIGDMYLAFDPETNSFSLNGRNSYTSIEDLFSAYEKQSNKKFTPLAPIPPENQWQFTRD